MHSDRAIGLLIDKQPHFGRYAVILAGGFHAAFVLLFAWLGATLLVFVNIFSVILYGYCWILLKSPEAPKSIFKIGLVVYGELMGHALIASYLIGSGSGFHYYLIPLTALLFLNQYDSQMLRSIKLAGIVPAFMFMEIYFAGHAVWYKVPEDVVYFLHHFNIAVSLSVATFVSYTYAKMSHYSREELFHSSTVDQLTGIYNRQHFTYLAQREVAANQRDNAPMSLIILDIDLFKQINDTYGHLCGDQALRLLADMLVKMSRAGDVVGRWGGEEFIVLLPNTSTEKALSVAERYRENIASLSVACSDANYSITITLGLATVTAKPSALESLVEMADMAMYQGKRSGRNQTVVYAESANSLATHSSSI